MSNTKFKVGQAVAVNLRGTVETWRTIPEGTQYLVTYQDNNGDEQERWFWEPEITAVTNKKPALAVIEGGKP